MARAKPKRNPAKSRRKAAPKGKRRPRSKQRRRWSIPWLRIGLVGLLLLGAYVVYLDVQVRVQFEGKRWALPAKVYARPLELFVGARMDAADLETELQALGYRKVAAPGRAGEYARNRSRFHIDTRGFVFDDGAEPGQRLILEFQHSRIEHLAHRDQPTALDLVRLDPLQIASIYPTHHEDRVLVRREDVPQTLVDTLLTVEDRDFYQHGGVSVRSIARAFWVNLRAMRLVQGGSTLTQQLVKNFYLSSERTLRRKLNEAGMALLLDLHYSKDEILEAYLNEVYLGQDGARAIHGFGLAARFYFDRSLDQLAIEEMALLVGLVKGPSYYDPRRHPERALARRNLILDMLVEQQLLDAETGAAARERPLGVLPKRSIASNAFPAFTELVRRQLREDYREEDLTSEGLRVFTTLDPQAQRIAEQTMTERLQSLEQSRALPTNSLQGAYVAAAAASGEILALVGGRDRASAGFNRALLAKRPIGSLVKPVVFLHALEEGGYTLASPLDDSPLTLEMPTGPQWQPQNYDKLSHGQVLLYRALAHSYNLATARLGLAVGVDDIAARVEHLSASEGVRALPSLLLGAVELTPLQVAQLYQSLANGGFHAPLRSIRTVLNAHGEPLQRYALEVRELASADAVGLLTSALQAVVREGTGRGLQHYLPASLGIAAKTGTTDDLRDSWFAGYSGDRVAVAWVGRDDNRPMGLSGAAGALPVWGAIMAQLDPLPLQAGLPVDTEWAWVEGGSGLRADDHCENRVQLPFLAGTVPQQWASCAAGPDQPAPGIRDWLRRWFE